MSKSRSRQSGGRVVRRKQPKRNTPLIVGLAVVGLIVLVGAGLALTRKTAVTEHFPAPPFANPHLENPTDPHPTYTSNPPTSGMHWGSGAAPWGVLTQPIADEITVHNLEHGGIIIHYRQGLDQATVDQIAALARELQRQNRCIIVIPRPTDKLDVPIAVTSWEYLLKLESFDAGAIRAFFKAHVNQGPEKLCPNL